MTDKTDIIDTFQSILEGDVILWNFEKDINMGEEKMRVYSKVTDNKG